MAQVDLTPRCGALRWLCWTALVLLTGCGFGGGGGGSSNSGIVWQVPPLPSAFDDGSANNQGPPAWLLSPEVVRRTLVVPPSPIEPADKTALEAAAIAAAQSFMAGAGFGVMNDVQVVGCEQDAYGGVHVELEQTYDGVPVVGRGAVFHSYPDKADTFSDHLVNGIALATTTPAVDPSTAATTATTKYTTDTGGAPGTTTSRLAILPSFDLVKTGSSRTDDHGKDFEWQFTGATLVYELVLGPGVEDLDAIATAIPESDNVEPDTVALRTLRDENITHGGHDSAPDMHEEHGPVGDEPAIRYFVDAQSGVVVSEHSLVDQLDPDDLEDSQTTGYGWHVGKVQLDTGFDPGTNRHYLIDQSRPSSGIGNVVYDAKNTETDKANDMAFMCDANGSWGDGSIVDSENASLTGTRRQTPAVDVYLGMMRTWDLFDNVLHRDGPDGKGSSLRACVHWGTEYGDAKYNGGSNFAFFGDGASPTEDGNYDIDVVGHEFGHYVWHKEKLGTDTKEARALNEGNGDIQGALVKLYQNTAEGTGPVIFHYPLLATWRWRVINPDGYSEPIEGTNFPAFGQKYWSSAIKDLPEHVGGIPLARAFVYLAEGAPADEDNTLHTEEFPNGLGGVGIRKAAQIWNHAMTTHLQGTPTYFTVGTAFGVAAADLFGNGSMEHNAVQRAFAGIRIGSGKADTEDPEITYASVNQVDLEDMTARVLLAATDDTGFRHVRAFYDDGDKDIQLGFYRGDLFLGPLDISYLPIGQSFVRFEVTDSDGRVDTAFRSVIKAGNRNLVDNGGFETSFSDSDWETTSGESPIGTFETHAFTGSRRARMHDEDMLYQQVSVPADAENVCLSFRLLISNQAADGDSFEAVVLDNGMGELEVLDEFHHLTSREGRTAYNKGYIRYEYDLSAYAGQTIHVAFRNHTEENSWLFHLDQVALTYEVEPYVDVPEVRLTPWENTVAFSIPNRGGMEDAEILRVEYWIGGPGLNPAPLLIATDPKNDYYNGMSIDDLPAAPNHWVGALVFGLDNQPIAQSWGVWIQKTPGWNELLVNGGFEAGGWDLAHTTGPPRIEVVSDNPNFQNAYDGENALRMGSQGTELVPGATIGQIVTVPFQVKTMDFSARVKIQTQEAGSDDELYLELWNADTFVMIEKLILTSSALDYSTPGDADAIRGYGNMAFSIDPGLYVGKNILVILRVEEDNGQPTTFYVDNVSLRYTSFGI